MTRRRFAAGLSAVLIAISRANDWGWTSGRTLGLIAGGLVLLVGLVAFERRHAEPLINMRTLARPPVLITDVATVEAELSKREADLESMQAKQRSLADLTALSTITVNLLGRAATPIAPSARGFVGGLRGGWHAFVVTLDGLLVVFGAVLPFLVVLGLPVILLLWWRRRARRPRPADPA